MQYKTYFLYIAFWLSLIPLRGQLIQDSIPCELIAISELMIENSPQIQRQRLRIDQARANRQSSASIFDYRMIADLSYNRGAQNLFRLDSRFEMTNGQIQTNNYISTVGVQRTFRSGLSSSINLDHSRIANNYPFDNFGETQTPFLSDNFTSVRMSLRQPLLRGRGRKFATTNEEFSTKMIESSVLDLTFVWANQLRNMSLAYWQYLSSFRRLSIYKENEKRVRKVLEITKELVKADRKAKNDLLQIQADLADKERQTFVAAQALFNTRQNLGRSIGLDEVESSKIGIPLNDYPTLEQANYSTEIDLENLLELARKNRADFKALLVAKEAIKMNFEQAQNNLKPQLDLLTSLSYGGTDVGNELRRVITPLNRIQGRNVQFSLGLNFQFPLNNNAAKADLIRNSALVSDQQVVIDNQIRNIELNISIALNDLHNSVLQLEKSYQALQFYQEVFAAEKVKFQNGLTTLLNLILFQERLTFSQLDYLRAQQDFAGTMINLRNETGTLVLIGQTSSFPIDNKVFYQLPDWE